MGGGGGLNTATLQKKLTNTASPQKSQQNTITATHIFSTMIRSSTLEIILLVVLHF